MKKGDVESDRRRDPKAPATTRVATGKTGRRLDAFDTLLTLAEVSLGLAGFAGIVVVFGRGPGALAPADSFRLLALVGCSLGTLFLSLVPIALNAVGLPEPELWQWSSAILLAVAVPAHLFAFLRIRRHVAEILEVLPIYMLPIGVSLFLANFIAQICNALGVGSLPIFGVYLIGLILYLGFAALQFARMLFVRPGGS